MGKTKPGAAWFDEPENPPMNTPEQLDAARREVISRFLTDEATLADMFGMLGLAEQASA